jgi:hypothetical protein
MLSSKKFTPPPPLRSNQRDVSMSNRTGIGSAISKNRSHTEQLDSFAASEQPTRLTQNALAATPLQNELNADRQLGDSSPSLPERRAVSEAEEDALMMRISNLWSTHALQRTEMSRSREQLRVLRLELGKDLSHYKEMLARTGRDGKWTPFLRERKIPRATADRYVRRWKESQMPAAEKRLTEAVPEPTPDEIAALAKKTSAKALKSLPTSDSRKQFLEVFSAAFDPPTPSCA